MSTKSTEVFDSNRCAAVSEIFLEMKPLVRRFGRAAPLRSERVFNVRRASHPCFGKDSSNQYGLYSDYFGQEVMIFHID